MPFIGFSRPKEQNVTDPLNVGDTFPASEEFLMDKPYSVIAFLRHVGCPFAENTVKQLRNWSIKNDHIAVFIVSHGNAEFTKLWIESIGGLGNLHLVNDVTRETHGLWGVGYSNPTHFIGIRSLAGAFALLLKGIHNRDACGTRWQKASMFAVNEKKILWAHKPSSAEEFLLPPESIFF